MEIFPESTCQGFPSEGNLGPFYSYGNSSSPYMATLSLPRLTIGLLISFFSTLVIPSVPTLALPSPSFESHHDGSKLDPSPSLPISSPSSFTFPSENFKSNKQEAMKNKKKMKKKKSTKQEADHVAVTSNAPPIGKPSIPPWKVRFACKMCKSDHLLRDYLSIPKS